MDRLVNNLSKDTHKYFLCNICWSCKTHLESVITRHKQLCSSENWSSVIHTLPSPGNLLEFKIFKYKTPAPFVIYIDCESKLDPINEKNTMLYQRHISCSAAALLVSNIPMLNNQWYIYTGDDVIVRLLEKLIEWEEKCINYLKIKRQMRELTRIQQMTYDAATVCRICKNRETTVRSRYG